MSTGRGARTRQRLLDVAERQLVACDGVLDVDRVAEEAGISVGGLYHHFPSKDALLATVVEAFHDRYDAAVVYADLGPVERWHDRERERIRRAVAFSYDEPLAPVLLTRTASDGTVARVDAERVQRAAQASARNLAEAVRAGMLPTDLDCDAAGAMLMGGVALVLASAVAQDPRPPADALAESLWTMVKGVVGG